MIATKARIEGGAKSAGTWSRVNEVAVSFDHASHVWAEHALRVDLTGPDCGQIAAEMDLASGRAVLAALSEVIEAAERSGVAT